MAAFEHGSAGTFGLAKAEAILVAAIEVNVPELVVARTTIGDSSP